MLRENVEFLQPVFAQRGSAYALSSGVCHERRWARRTVYARFEVAFTSVLQEEVLAVRGLLGRGSDDAFRDGK